MFVVLPTGIGVLDELFEILVLKSYGELKQRIVIVNIENMYDNLKVLKDVNLHVAKGEWIPLTEYYLVVTSSYMINLLNVLS